MLAGGVGANGSVIGTRTAADVQGGGDVDNTRRGVGAGGAVLIDVAQGDPAVLGPAPVAALFIDFDSGAVGQTTYPIAVLGGVGADVQFLGNDDALGNHGGAAVAGGIIVSAVGAAATGGAAGVDIVQTDPAVAGAAPAVGDLQNGDYVALAVAADDLAGGRFADVQGVAGDDALQVQVGAAFIVRTALTAGAALLAPGRRGGIAGIGIIRGDIHFHIVHDDPAGLRGGDVAPGVARRGLLLQDLHPIAGGQVALSIGVPAGVAANNDLLGNGAGILVDQLRLLRYGVDGVSGGGIGGFRQIRQETVGFIAGDCAVVGSAEAAGQKGACKAYRKGYAQRFAELFSIGEIHGVTSLSSHFSTIL